MNKGYIHFDKRWMYTWPHRTQDEKNRSREYTVGNREKRLPWGLSGKESVCQCRRCGFNLWVERMSWRRKWLLTPVLLPGESQGRGGWRATIHGIAESNINNGEKWRSLRGGQGSLTEEVGGGRLLLLSQQFWLFNKLQSNPTNGLANFFSHLSCLETWLGFNSVFCFWVLSFCLILFIQRVSENFCLFAI